MSGAGYVRRSQNPSDRRSVLVGIVFVLYLVYTELFTLNAICLYCTAVHIVTFALLIVLTRVSPAQLGWARSRSE